MTTNKIRFIHLRKIRTAKLISKMALEDFAPPQVGFVLIPPLLFNISQTQRSIFKKQSMEGENRVQRVLSSPFLCPLNSEEVFIT
jgi:hypothetical protein